MNKIALLTSFTIVISLFLSCNCDDCGGGNGYYPIEATINFINETSDSIKSTEGCDLDIDSGSSLTFEVKNNLGGKPNIDNFPVSIFSNCSMMYKDGNIFRCEKGIEDIKSYENRVQLASKEDTLVFEFTFRFTELKKANAEPCN